MRNEAKKDYLHPITGIRNHNNNKGKRATQKHSVATQQGKKQKSPSVVRLVSRDPWVPKKTNNKQDTAPPNVHQQTCADSLHS